jgi:type IV secretory pathway VirB3-like protein
MSESANEIGKLTIVGSVIGGCLTFDIGTLLQIKHAAGIPNMIVFYVAVLLSIVACGYGILALLRYFIVFEVDRDESFYHALLATYLGFNIMVVALVYWRLPPRLAYHLSMFYILVIILAGMRIVYRNRKRLMQSKERFIISKDKLRDARIHEAASFEKLAKYIGNIELLSLSFMYAILCHIDKMIGSHKDNAPNAMYRNLYEECQGAMLDVYIKLKDTDPNNANSIETAKTAQIIVVGALENLSRRLSVEAIKQHTSPHPGLD